MAEQTKPSGWNHARVESASTSRSSPSPFESDPRGASGLAEAQSQQAARSVPSQDGRSRQPSQPTTTSLSSGPRYSAAEAKEIRSRAIDVIGAGLERRLRLQAQQTQVPRPQNTVQHDFNVSSTATQNKSGNVPGTTLNSTQPSGWPGPSQSPMQMSSAAGYAAPNPQSVSQHRPQ